MQSEYPHEIQRFEDGKAVPAGYLELTEEEFALLNPMPPDERAKWLRGNGRTSLLAGILPQLTQAPTAEPRRKLPGDFQSKMREAFPSTKS